MLLNLKEDEELLDMIKDYISALLPHHNLDDKSFLDVKDTLFKYVKLEEFNGPMYVLLWVIDSVASIRELRTYGSPIVKREIVSTVVSANIVSLTSSRQVFIQDLLIDSGLSTNLEIKESMDEARNLLYRETLKLYDECIEREKIGSEVLLDKISLEALFKRNATETMLANSQVIAEGTLKIGKRYYTGYEGILEYNTQTSAEIRKRTEAEEGDRIIIDSISKSKALNERALAKITPNFHWGIPRYDHTEIIEDFGVLKHRYILLLANPSGYKTSTMCCMAARAILENKVVNFMCGESELAEIKNKIQSSYIYLKFQKMVHHSMIARGGDGLPEETQRLIRIADAECSTGKLQLKVRYPYRNLYDALANDYQKVPFDVLIMDHTAELERDDKLTEFENFSALSRGIKTFRNDFPVSVFVISHLSATFKDLLSKGKLDGSGTKAKGNAELENDADEIYYAHSTEDMKRQYILEFHCFKRREDQSIPDPVRVSTLPVACSFEYRDDIQISDLRDDAVTESMVLDEAREMYSNDFDTEDDDDFLDFDDEDVEVIVDAD